MSKYLLTCLLAMVAFVQANAVPDFSSAKKYHIVCQQFPDGCVVDGLTAGRVDTPLYYNNQPTTASHSYWIVNEEGGGRYSIQNAETKGYVTYDGVYSGAGRRYVCMTPTISGDLSLWTFKSVGNGMYTIRNVEHGDHLWDVRTSSFTVGSYSSEGDGGSNQHFSFYDQYGNQVFERTVSEGFDVTSWLTGTPDALEGWTNSGFFMNTGAGGSHFNGDASLEAPFIENWHEAANGPLADCRLQQTLTHLPGGNYRLQADALAVFQGYPEERG